MTIQDKLQIVLVTYNRRHFLERTLQQLLDEKSPVRDFSITVLDNNSTDGTEDLVKQFQQTHPHNLGYHKNKYNVGLGGNLIKAMELADKKYLWIVCDDDFFDWQNWPEIQQAIEEEYDLIVTSWAQKERNTSIPYILNNLSFVPAGIYHTKHITDLTMQNAYAMAYNLLPFHAMGIKIVNEKGRIFVPQRKVVIQSEEPKSHEVRKLKKGLFYKWNKFNLLWAYVDAYNLIEDKKLRYACCNELALDSSFFSSMLFFLSIYPFCWHHFFDVFCTISWRQKFWLCMAVLTKLSPLSFYRTDKGINIRLFYVIKTRLIPFKRAKNIN